MKYIILAGGSGTRLWPMSRQSAPKQFIDLIDHYSMLQNTVKRVTKENGGDMYVIANETFKFVILDQIRKYFHDFNEKHIIIEPCAKNTAPAIAYGALFFDDNETIAILSSDHHITDAELFNRALDNAAKIAEQGYIVTLGIVPDTPRTGYGYIKKSTNKIGNGYVVEKFVEKPDRATAEHYLKDGNYYWNAGIFIFKVGFFLKELEKHAPQLYATLMDIRAKMQAGGTITVEDFDKFEKISIDYALMEKSRQICVVPAQFGWSDVGSFKSLYDTLPHDGNNNALKIKEDEYVNIETTNSLVIGSGRKIATIGLHNLTVIDTPDALLIADNAATEKVKDVVAKLETMQAKELINHKTVYRPWGSYTILDEGPNYKVKQLFICPEQKISLQYHLHRSENWTVVGGTAEVTRGDETFTLQPSENVFIPATVHHRLYNPSKMMTLKIIEVQTGEYLGEDDIIRLQDEYDRK